MKTLLIITDNNQKELVKTMEKLVDAKEEARHQEMLRRRKAEREGQFY